VTTGTAPAISAPSREPLAYSSRSIRAISAIGLVAIGDTDKDGGASAWCNPSAARAKTVH